jgi:hypothetical protein
MDTAVNPAKRKAKPRSRDYSLAVLKYPQDAVNEFNRIWEQWPKSGWNFSTKSEGARRVNYNEALERFMDILAHTDIQIDAHTMTASDLADVAIHYAVRVIRQAHGNPPTCCCISNFFSCVENMKHPWKEELLNMAGFIK